MTKSKGTNAGIVLIALLLFIVTGCAFISSAPSSFTQGAGGETTILLRPGLGFEKAFREVTFTLNRHGFEPEMMESDAGYIRTRWSYSWNERGTDVDYYRVRIIGNFNPSRTQLILNAEAEFLRNNSWVRGFDTRAVKTLRDDLTALIGN